MTEIEPKDDLDTLLAGLRGALRPVFDDQNTLWEKEGPAALARAAAVGLAIDSQGGNCPVQIEGSIDGRRFYFRARHDEYQVHVAESENLIFDDPIFYVERDYENSGWMPLHIAIGLLCDEVEAWQGAAK